MQKILFSSSLFLVLILITPFSSLAQYTQAANSGSSVATPVSTTTSTAPQTPVLGACTDTTAPWVKVVSPNGGEVLGVGQLTTIKWQTCNFPLNINTQVDINDDRVVGWIHTLFGFVPALNHAQATSIAAGVINYEYSFIVPSQFNWPTQYLGVFGDNHYKIAVIVGGSVTQTQADYSDAPFTITPPTTPTTPSSAASVYNASGTNQSATGTYANSSTTSQVNQGSSGYQAYSVGSGAINAGVPNTSSGTKYIFTTDLEFGIRGEAVRQLQLVLITQGLLAADNATGYFGPLTRVSVQEFQKRNNLPSVGRVGPLTRAVLNK
ncbi:MAG: peptidoglycan-binding protein [Candidatus Pacebacteria bacterium]|nr:peptidoglycan-binding protein [Candidatus Paceibacterota bacterium]